MEEGHERVCEIIHNDIYVDDCISDENCPEDVRTTTDGLKLVLSRGGFSLKGGTMSGSDPPPPPTHTHTHTRNTSLIMEIPLSLEKLNGPTS